MSERTAPPLDGSGPAAPPRANGELVFESPWESRVFGVTLALCERGVFEWHEFQGLLVAEIEAWQRTSTPGATYRYYERWQAALERLLDARGICGRAELEERERAYAARPHGHDH